SLLVYIVLFTPPSLFTLSPTTHFYTLSLHDALPISGLGSRQVHQHGLRALAAGAVARAVGHVEADEELLAGVSGHRPTIQAFVLDPFGNQLPRAFTATGVEEIDPIGSQIVIAGNPGDQQGAHILPGAGADG